MKKTDVFEHFKSAKNIARALNIYPQAVHQWTDIVPKARAFELFIKSNGSIPIKEDDYAEEPFA